MPVSFAKECVGEETEERRHTSGNLISHHSLLMPPNTIGHKKTASNPISPSITFPLPSERSHQVGTRAYKVRCAFYACTFYY